LNLAFPGCKSGLSGFSVFDVPEGIQNLRNAANHNISTHKA
jgi:hypothetical protein